MTRSTMLEVLRQDYVRTARAKGIRETTTLLRHALPNAGLPILTLAGLQFAALLGGSVVIETVFVLPGVGSLLVNSIQRRDYFVTQGIIVSFALIVVLLNLLVDLLYGWLDPRIRYA
jgi:peptide/nickel transport system permease protein